MPGMNMEGGRGNNPPALPAVPRVSAASVAAAVILHYSDSPRNPWGKAQEGALPLETGPPSWDQGLLAQGGSCFSAGGLGSAFLRPEPALGHVSP